MSTRHRCTAQHPTTGQRCERRAHAAGEPHRIWRRQPEVTWRKSSPPSMTITVAPVAAPRRVVAVGRGGRLHLALLLAALCGLSPDPLPSPHPGD